MAKLKKPYLEKDFQTKLKHYIQANRDDVPDMLCEAKISSGGTINLNSFQPQQLPSLEEAYEGGFYFKLSDASLGLKPADFFFVKDGYVALLFWKNKQQSVGWFLHISHVLDIKKSGAKSIKESDCKELGIKIEL